MKVRFRCINVPWTPTDSGGTCENSQVSAGSWLQVSAASTLISLSVIIINSTCTLPAVVNMSDAVGVVIPRKNPSKN